MAIMLLAFFISPTMSLVIPSAVESLSDTSDPSDHTELAGTIIVSTNNNGSINATLLAHPRIQSRSRGNLYGPNNDVYDWQTSNTRGTVTFDINQVSQPLRDAILDLANSYDQLGSPGNWYRTEAHAFDDTHYTHIEGTSAVWANVLNNGVILTHALFRQFVEALGINALSRFNNN
ncbi:unnamed protein product [Didymodactylos carnosus]|uniref:Uncharacterized protein n=1 Tax=Didymodactylos carnosus TaxID=1234261 RepID=A0A8S2S2U6_9BILA|nr:unnamed protein product [Didymodactylos carnosus]CAF4198515.1 unnamed protein product [Didymodactylos carnosus]